MTVIELKIIAPSAMMGCKSPNIDIGIANVLYKKAQKDFAV